MCTSISCMICCAFPHQPKLRSEETSCWSTNVQTLWTSKHEISIMLTRLYDWMHAFWSTLSSCQRRWRQLYQIYFKTFLMIIDWNGLPLSETKFHQPTILYYYLASSALSCGRHEAGWNLLSFSILKQKTMATKPDCSKNGLSNKVEQFWLLRTFYRK